MGTVALAIGFFLLKPRSAEQNGQKDHCPIFSTICHHDRIYTTVLRLVANGHYNWWKPVAVGRAIDQRLGIASAVAVQVVYTLIYIIKPARHWSFEFRRQIQLQHQHDSSTVVWLEIRSPRSSTSSVLYIRLAKRLSCDYVRSICLRATVLWHLSQTSWTIGQICAFENGISIVFRVFGWVYSETDDYDWIVSKCTHRHR